MEKVKMQVERDNLKGDAVELRQRVEFIIFGKNVITNEN